MKRLLCSLVVLLGISSTRLPAVDLTFTSPAFEIGKDSSGGLLTGSYTFALGSFGSFTPTALNTSEWLANFTQLGAVQWDETWTQFSGQTSLTANTAPFQTTSQGYIWGYNLTSGSAEWILITSTNWKFPVASTLLPVQWGTADSDVVAILGTLGTALTNADPYLQTQAVGATAVPEPATVAAILGLAAVGLTLVRRRSTRT